jgi:tungstate transport system substrate-binding protein
VVAFNYFTIAGPPDDPANVRGAASAVEGLQRIARAGRVFVSRGDSSGTHVRELALWTEGGGRPSWPGYLETGQGMSASLLVANDRRGYTLTDRSTFGAMQQHLDLVALRDIDVSLRNVYHVIEVNPAGQARVNAAGGTAFADFVTSQEVQDLLATFGTSRYGAPLFTPARGVEPR